MSIDLNDPVPIWNGSDQLGAILNVGSNIFVLPAVALALWRRDFASAIVYSQVFVASNLYHACRAGLLCVYEFEKHEMTDYLFVYQAIVWTTTRIAIRSPREHIVAFLFFAGVAYFSVFAKASEVALPLFGLGLPLISMFLVALTMGRRTFGSWIWALVSFALFAVGGAFMFIADPGDYWWAHAAWHVFSMSAIFTAELAILPDRIRSR